MRGLLISSKTIDSLWTLD